MSVHVLLATLSPAKEKSVWLKISKKFCEITLHPHAVTNQLICLFDELCKGQNGWGSWGIEVEFLANRQIEKTYLLL